MSDFEGGATDPHLSTYQRYARAIGYRVLVHVGPVPLEDDT